MSCNSSQKSGIFRLNVLHLAILVIPLDFIVFYVFFKFPNIALLFKCLVANYKEISAVTFLQWIMRVCVLFFLIAAQ